MASRTVGLTPLQIAPRNPRRAYISVQLLPNNIAAGNTGLVYGKFGSAPVASLSSNTWDFVLNAGAADGDNLYQARDTALISEELWIISDTADQIINVVERSQPVSPIAAGSEAAAS